MQITQEQARKVYAEWIISVRKKAGLKQEEFGKKIFHFEFADKKEACMTYHRNSVGNWEKCRNLPNNLEAVISIALLEYQILHRDNCAEEGEKYTFVQSRLFKYYGRCLYCRNINDALLVEAIRGLYSMEELPEVRMHMKQIIFESARKQGEKYALKTVTESLEHQLILVKTREAFEKLVKSWSSYFFLGNKTFGVRMKKMYEDRQKGQNVLSFKQAVNIYAPRYRESYNKIFSSDSCVSRKWILDLCMHLHFNRAEINRNLKNANMLPLSEIPLDLENEIIEEGGEIGTISWYEEKIKGKKEDFMIRYPEMAELSLREKFAFCTLFSCYIAQEESVRDLPPVDYILEYFIQNEEGKRILAQGEVIRKKEEERGEEEPESVFENLVYRMADILNETREKLERKAEKRAYQEYQEAFGNYVRLPEVKERRIYDKVQGEKLHFLAAIFFSVFTGRLYMGELLAGDIGELKESLAGNGADMVVFRFLSAFLVVFLDTGELKEEEGMFYIEREGKKGVQFNLTELQRELCAAWNLLCEKCTN